MQTCIWPSWCHCHSLSLALIKSRLVLPFWYQLTRVVLDKGPLNGCVCVCVCFCLNESSVLLHCWLDIRKSARPVKIEWWGAGVVICKDRGADYLHIVQLMPLHPKTLSSLASFKCRLVLPFWYRLTQEKRPLNGYSSSSSLCHGSVTGILVSAFHRTVPLIVLVGWHSVDAHITPSSTSLKNEHQNIQSVIGILVILILLLPPFCSHYTGQPALAGTPS